jgi:hypothetical protein
MSRFIRLANAVRRPAVASTAAGMCLTMSLTGLAVADTTGGTPASPRTATVSISDAAYTSAQHQERRRHPHNPHGSTFVHRHGKHVRVHGTAKDPDRPHKQLAISVWRNGHRIRVVKTHWRRHHYHVRLRLHFGKNRFVVRARNIGRGLTRSHLRTVQFHRAHHHGWARHFRGNQRIAARMLHRHGWGHSQMQPLIALWNRESGWSKTAYNSSGAYGIPQALPGSKMSSAGPNWRYNAHTQIRWGMRYIQHRYGSPANAWAHSQSSGWY